MTAEVLRRAVDHVVGAVGERAVVDGRGERRVDHQRHSPAVTQLGGAGDVDHAQIRIRRRLGEEELRVVAQRLLELLQVARVDHRGLDVEPREVLLDELARAAVAVARHHQVAAARQQRQEERGGRAHAGREQHRLLGALELAELALDGAPGRIAVATVLLAVEPALLVGAQLLGVREPERGRLIDRRGDGVALLVRALAAVDGARRVARRAFAHVRLVAVALSSAGAESPGVASDADPGVRGPASTGNHPAFSNPDEPRYAGRREPSTSSGLRPPPLTRRPDRREDRVVEGARDLRLAVRIRVDVPVLEVVGLEQREDVGAAQHRVVRRAA